MKKLFRLSSAAIIFILVLSLFSSPILSNSNAVLAQEVSPTLPNEPAEIETPTPVPTQEPQPTPTEEPTAESTMLPTEEMSLEPTSSPEEFNSDVPVFRWSIQINGKSQGPSTKAMQTLNSLKSQGVMSEFVNNRLQLSGLQDIDQMKQTIFESLPEGFDFMGGPISLLINYPAETGKEVIIHLEVRTTTGYEWVLLPSSEFEFTQSGSSEYHARSTGMGVPSVQTMRFIPNFSGTGTLHLAYQRVFEPDLPISTEMQIDLVDAPVELDLSDPMPKNVEHKSAVIVGEESTTAFDDIPLKGIVLPGSFDWRSYGVVPAVRDQGACGSCWAFGTVGVMESAVNIGGGGLPNLSEQMLVSCNRDDWGCNGGLTAHKYHFNVEAVGQMYPGAVYEYDMPYIGQPLGSGCLLNDKIAYKLSGWEFVTGSEWTVPTVDEIKSAIYTYGPVTAGVCAGSGWNTYSGGVYSTDDDCGGGTNHQIILVGWDDSTQTWILRNSWGPYWGDEGYMHIRWNTSRVGEGTSWVKYGLSSTIPTAPTLVSPVSGFVTNDPNVNLSWSEVIFGTSYDVQVDNNADFSSPESTGTSISETSYLPAGLLDGKYYWRVRAKNLIDQTGSWSSSRYFTIDATPPVPPVLSTPINGSQVVGTPTFTWLASATASHYQLQYETTIDGDPETYLFRSPEVTTLSYKPGVTPYLMAPLYWSVRAKDSIGNWSAWSTPFTVTVVPPVPLKPVLTSPVSGLLTNNPAPTLAWNMVAYADTYEIQVDTTYTFLAPLVQEHVGITELSHVIDSLPDGKYYWRVRARNVNNAAGAWSAYRYFSIDTTAPAVPVLTKPLNGSQSIGTPTFTWLASATAKYYQVQCDDVDDGTDTYDYLSLSNITVLTHKPTVTPSLMTVTYWYVRAQDPAGNWSAWSAPFTVTVVPPVPLKPVLTTPVSGLVTNNPSPTLAWNTVAYADTYEIQIDTTYTFLAPLVQEYVGITSLNHILDPLPDGKYYWRVRARNVNNAAGAWAAYRYFTIDTTAPAAPVLSQPAENAPGIRTMPTFSWLGAATANAYQFQYDNDTAFSDPVSYTSPVLTVLSHKPSLTMSVGTWYWRVRARDAVGNWGAWSPYRTLTILPPAVTNGNFEAGGASWSQYSSNGYALITTSLPISAHNGSYAAWLGGDDYETSLLTQTGINMSGVRYLHFWYFIGSEDYCGYDFGRVWINGVVIKTYNLCSSTNSSGWTHQVIDLQSYTGNTISLEFSATTDVVFNSNFFVDDVSITNSSSTPVTATVTMTGSNIAERKK